MSERRFPWQGAACLLPDSDEQDRYRRLLANVLAGGCTAPQPGEPMPLGSKEAEAIYMRLMECVR